MSSPASFNINQILNGIRELAPLEFARINSKIYKGVDRFSDFRHLLANLAIAKNLSALPVSHRMTEMDRQMMLLQSIAFDELTTKNVPTYFVEPSILKACLNTELNGVVDWAEMKLPFEAGIFVFPKNFLLFPDGGECGNLLWTRFKQKSYKFIQNSLKFEQPSFLMLTSSLKDYNLHRFLNQPYESSLPVELYDFIESKYQGDELLRLSQNEKEFELRLNNLLFNLLLVMTTRESVVKNGSRIGRQKNQKKNPKEIWLPNLVGSDYRIQRKYSDPSQPSGISLVSHWRKGHWRIQHYGEQCSLSKRIWIEPYQTGF